MLRMAGLCGGRRSPISGSAEYGARLKKNFAWQVFSSSVAMFVNRFQNIVKNSHHFALRCCLKQGALCGPKRWISALSRFWGWASYATLFIFMKPTREWILSANAGHVQGALLISEIVGLAVGGDWMIFCFCGDARTFPQNYSGFRSLLVPIAAALGLNATGEVLSATTLQGDDYQAFPSFHTPDQIGWTESDRLGGRLPPRAD